MILHSTKPQNQIHVDDVYMYIYIYIVQLQKYSSIHYSTIETIYSLQCNTKKTCNKIQKYSSKPYPKK